MARLTRDALAPWLANRWDNPGLLLDRGLAELASEPAARGEGIGGHIRRVCDLPVPDVYRKAYERWERVTDDEERFVRWFGRVEGRLFIGLGMPHVLETQVIRNRIYGVPLIPGSTLKGLAWRGAGLLGLDTDSCEVLFGRDGDQPEDMAAGYLVFHDAWWVPGSAETPFVPEIVTVHHQRYYETEGQEPATPCDSPNPNHQIAVRGSFLFAVEGARPWAELGMEALRAALRDEGLGGKVAAGYGYFREEEDAQAAAACVTRREETARRKLEAVRKREAARRQQEETERIARMSERERRLYALQQRIEEAHQARQGHALSQELLDAINREIKALFDEAPEWAGSERGQAAALIERAYDQVLGWHAGGKDGKRRRKQEERRRQRIAALREGRRQA